MSVNYVELKGLEDITMMFNEPLKGFTFTKTGGPADVIALPKTNEELVALVKHCEENDVPWLVIGHGSNIIVRDSGIRGVVILLTNMNKILVQEKQMTVQAGAKLIDVSYTALYHNLTGLEFACGIPGSVGGAVFMNAGAYGGEIKDILVSADVLLPDGKIRTLSNKELEFSYRRSIISRIKCIVLQATFTLEKGDTNAIKIKMDELTRLRESKQPLEYPSCGSVFKRPVGYFAGKLIQDAGLQGLTRGGVQVSMKHAGFIVNINNGTASNYIELISYIQMIVKEKFGVSLELEVRILGETGGLDTLCK